MTYTITLDTLKERGACEERLERFKEMFGERCEITLEKAVEYVQKYGTDNLWWFYNHVESLSIIPIACGNNYSNGNNWSNGTSHSFGLLHCHGAYQCFFRDKQKRNRESNFFVHGQRGEGGRSVDASPRSFERLVPQMDEPR